MNKCEKCGSSFSHLYHTCCEKCCNTCLHDVYPWTECTKCNKATTTNKVEELLIKGTGEGSKYWLDFIGNRIKQHSLPSDNPLHEATESNLWLRDLSDAVWSRVPSRHDLSKMDENIITSTLMSLILTLWSVRIRRAKAYDPRRPIEIRKLMMERNLLYQTAILECMLDESRDHEFFPAQTWDPPYSPDAKDGDYV